VASCGHIVGHKFSRNLFPTRGCALGIEMPEKWKWPYQRPSYTADTSVRSDISIILRCVMTLTDDFTVAASFHCNACK